MSLLLDSQLLIFQLCSLPIMKVGCHVTDFFVILKFGTIKAGCGINTL